MTFLEKGEKVDLIGPLGNGFALPPLPSSRNGILIGGGMGIVSLYPLVEAFGEKRCHVFVGGRTEYDILCVEDFKKFHSKIFLATEDGSLGYTGTVVDLFLSQRKVLKRDEVYYVYACGPAAMLKALAGAEKPKNIICYASLEARMACGFGACWGCVVKTKQPKKPYQRVCEEGPVFRLDDIVWE